MLIVDKPAGLSSFQALSPVKRYFNTKKIGHTGTLDPFATGVMVVLVGKATRLAPWLSGMPKKYIAEIEFGVETDTLDPEGTVTETLPVPPIDSILSQTSTFLGKITQVPPRYSAINLQGERAYKKARRGEEIDLPSRMVEITSLELVPVSGTRVTMTVECSSGTYIRSLARDIAHSAGTVAHLTVLRRVSVGPFSETSAIPVDRPDQFALISPEEIILRLPGMTVSPIDESFARYVLNGKPLSDAMIGIETDGTVALLEDGSKIAAIVERRDGSWKYRFVWGTDR